MEGNVVEGMENRITGAETREERWRGWRYSERRVTIIVAVVVVAVVVPLCVL